ncbi:FAD binding domain-containing protein [Xylariaceae sp. FL0255]|nr:FAD binding domain-containing protein [Xylariaceae sp. FL0255]
MALSPRTRGLLTAASLLAVGVAQDTCAMVGNLTSIEVLGPLALGYITDQTEYWSSSCSDLLPSCILKPTTTEEVAAIVSILATNNETFATKSGGHNPNNWFASVDGGPLISTEALNEVILDIASETVTIGPGNRWDDVSAALDGTGYTAVGGRIGNVGVGGYMLGGGLSFMSTQYGWAANSVLQYTLVLANATILTVTNETYPEIFMVLKGGGNNFGIVTSYVVQAYPQGDVWGGTLLIDADDETDAQMLAALRDFTEYYPDEKAAVIVTGERTLATLARLWVVFLYYNGPEVPAGVFDNFTSIGTPISTAKTQSLNSLLSANNIYVLKGQVYTIGTETMPLPSAANLDVMNEMFQTWVNVSNTVALVPGVVASIAFQPAPKMLATIAASKGGDMIDIDADVDRIFIELDYSFTFNASYPEIDTTMRNTYRNLQATVQKNQAAGALPSDVFLPLFQNDCFYPEDYWGRLRPEKLALAQRVQADVDPTGFFATRTGGFKIPST